MRRPPAPGPVRPGAEPPPAPASGEGWAARGVSAETRLPPAPALVAAVAAACLAAPGLAAPASAQPAMDASRVRTDTFAYDVRFDGDPLGTLRVSYARAEVGGLRVREAVSGTLGDEVTTTVVGRDLRPVSARREGRLARASSELDLSYEGGRVTGRATVPADSAAAARGPGETRTVEVDRELAPGVLDSNTLVAAILASPLAPGDTLRYPLFRPGRGVVEATARVAGAASSEVPAGTFPTYRVELSTDQGAFTLWVTRETPRALVRQAFRARPVEVVLRAVGADSASVADDAGRGAGRDSASGGAPPDGARAAAPPDSAEGGSGGR